MTETANQAQPVHVPRSSALASMLLILSLGGSYLLLSERVAHLPTSPIHPVLGVVDPGLEGRPPAPQATEASFRTQELSGKLSLSQSVVLEGPHADVGALLEVQGLAQEDDAPVSIAVVIDTSGSMRGRKIEQAKQALLNLIAQLRPQDSIAVVRYSTHASVLVSLTDAGDDRGRIARQIHDLYADGSTNIQAGLALGATVLRNAPQDSVKRLLLLSDGQDTFGANARNATRSALSSTGIVTVSSLGVGSDFDENFMSDVADEGHGNYAFLANDDRMHAFLEAELSESRHTVAEGLVLELELPDNWTSSRMEGADLRSSNRGSARYFLRSVNSDHPVVLSTHLRGPAMELGTLGEVSVKVRYQSIHGGEREQQETPLAAVTLSVESDETLVEASRNLNAHAQLRMQELGEQQRQAVRAYREGNLQQAADLNTRTERELDSLAAAAPAQAQRMRPMMESSRRMTRAITDFAPGSSQGDSEARRANAASGAVSRGRSVEASTY